MKKKVKPKTRVKLTVSLSISKEVSVWLDREKKHFGQYSTKQLLQLARKQNTLLNEILKSNWCVDDYVILQNEEKDYANF